MVTDPKDRRHAAGIATVAIEMGIEPERRGVRFWRGVLAVVIGGLCIWGLLGWAVL